jgi:hypothetical protein
MAPTGMSRHGTVRDISIHHEDSPVHPWSIAVGAWTRFVNIGVDDDSKNRQAFLSGPPGRAPGSIDQCSNSPSLRTANDGQPFLNQESGLDAGSWALVETMLMTRRIAL